MYLKIDEITNETPVLYLTVGQLMAIWKGHEKRDQAPVKIQIPEIFGLDQACELTGYSKATIYAKTSRNEIPHFKRDNKLLFRKADVVAWMTENPVETVDEFSRKMDDKLTTRRGR